MLTAVSSRKFSRLLAEDVPPGPGKPPEKPPMPGHEPIEDPPRPDSPPEVPPQEPPPGMVARLSEHHFFLGHASTFSSQGKAQTA